MSHATRFQPRGIVRWHERLTGYACLEKNESAPRKIAEDAGMRGERADLKRAVSSQDVMLSPSFATLVGFCYPATIEKDESLGGITPWEIEALSRTAMVMAHVDWCHSDRSFPESLAAGHDRPAVSEARVAGLLRTQDVEDAARQIRMMVPMISGGIDAIRLHDAFWDWERRRKEWAVAYHLVRIKAKRKTDMVA